MSGDIDAAREFRLAGAIEDLMAEDLERSEPMWDSCDRPRAVVDDLVMAWVVRQRDQVFSNN